MGTNTEACTTIQEFGDALAPVNERTVVFLDIDNTLLTCDGPGSEHWEKAMTKAINCDPGNEW